MELKLIDYLENEIRNTNKYDGNEIEVFELIIKDLYKYDSIDQIEIYLGEIIDDAIGKVYEYDYDMHEIVANKINNIFTAIMKELYDINYGY